MSLQKRNNCRYCRSTDLTMFVSLGEHPPSNSFITIDQISSEKKYPLDVYLCNNCFLAQLLDVVSAKSIFDDYYYLSSSSKALVNHYTQMTSDLSNRFNLKTGDLVVDIGSNDGITLNAYSHPNLRKVGVEPSKVSEIAIKSGLDIIKSFFNIDTSREILDKYGKAQIVTATNVFAHIDNMHSFMEGLPNLLDDNGVFVVEVSYLVDLINKSLFDTIYHEHLCYLSLTPVVPFLAEFGLEVFDVKRFSIGASGPAIRFFIKKKSSNRPVKSTVKNMRNQEKIWGIESVNIYKDFGKKIELIKKETLELIYKLKSVGSKIGGFGAPAKGNTLLNYYGLTAEIIECIAENNKLKQGKITPGSHIPIISDAKFLEHMPEYSLLLTWNYLDFFLEHSQYIKKGGKFIVPLPSPRIVP